MSRTRSTTLLGVLGLVVVLVAGWLLVLAPRMSEASELEAQAEAVAAANVATTAEIAALREQEEQLPRARARAAVLSAQFPPDIAQPELYDLLRRAAAAAGLPEQAITDVAPTVPALGSADGSVTLPATPPGSTDAAAAPTDPASAPAAGAPAAAAAGGASSVAVTTVDLNLTGPRDRLLRFVRELENLDRAYLMGEVSVGGVEGGVDGPGSFTLAVSGTMYMLPPLLDPAAAAEQAEAAQAAAADTSDSDAVTP